ncbi:MAG: hypothetical protein FWC10_09675 [Lentimicrobiaceae bacterium]|nr:hypothetical protein [Lentimicrobiaceae bacterium]
MGLDFAVNFLATVLGVFLGFFLRRMYDDGKTKGRDKDIIEKTKENLKAELNSIVSSLEEKEWADIIHIDTPVWRSVGATGSILEILREDRDIYKRLYSIYDKLFLLTNLQINFTENENKICKLRTEIKNEILEVLKQWKKEQSQSRLKN